MREKVQLPGNRKKLRRESWLTEEVSPPIQRTARNDEWSGTLVTFALKSEEARKGYFQLKESKGRNLKRETLPKG